MRASFPDRVVLMFILGMPWWFFWALVSAAVGDTTPLGLFGSLPWLFLILDAIVERIVTSGDITRMTAKGDVVLATRAEYVGGHPQLPHGRFAYLTLRGDREIPLLTIYFPSQDGDGDSFDIPVLDIDKTKPESEKEASLSGTLLATLTEKPGRFFGERVTLNVDYQGPGGRKQKVELTSFFHGADEIRNWRNYLICAQAEADTGNTPFGPWKSLKSTPQEETSDDGAGDGSKVQPSRRAFERR